MKILITVLFATILFMGCRQRQGLDTVPATMEELLTEDKELLCTPVSYLGSSWIFGKDTSTVMGIQSLYVRDSDTIKVSHSYRGIHAEFTTGEPLWDSINEFPEVTLSEARQTVMRSRPGPEIDTKVVSIRRVDGITYWIFGRPGERLVIINGKTGEILTR